MDVAEVRKIVGVIKNNLFKHSNSHSIGMLKSHFRGTGLQFKEHQVYTHGDDVRFIDWKILAKTGSPYIKTFEEERNVEIVVVIDCSQTMFNGYKGKSKIEAAIEISCLLYLLAQETKDYVHVVILADEIVSLPLKAGEEGISFLFSMLEKMEIIREGKINYNYSRKKELSDSEKQKILMKHLGKKREVVILSDFNDLLNQETMRRIVFGSKVHAFRIVGPLDEAKKTPYMIHCRSEIGKESGNLVRVEFEKKEELQNEINKRIKKINVKDRYLEEFIEEML